MSYLRRERPERSQLSRLARTGDDVRFLRCIRCGAPSRQGLCRECAVRRCRTCGRKVSAKGVGSRPTSDRSLCSRCWRAAVQDEQPAAF